MKTIFFLQSSHCQSNRAELAGVVRAGKAYGWNVRILEYANAAEDRRQHATGKVAFRDEFRRMREFWSPIGVIADCGAAPVAFRKNEFAPLPTVFLDRHPSTIGRGAVCVSSDADEIGRLAARELLALDYATYAYVPFGEKTAWSIYRERAYANALAANRRSCVVFHGGSPHAGGLAYLRELDRWLAKLPKPAAVFAANDYIGEFVLTAAGKCGLRVPNDVAVIGVDDDEEICLRTSPTLSSIKPDHERAGYLAATLLKQLIADPAHPPASATFGPLAAFSRGSIRALHRRDERVAKVMETIRERATAGVSVTDVIGETGLSRRLVEMRFRETTGHSIFEEIQAVRIEHAKVALSQSRASMDEVAKASGFPSAQALRKTFLQKMGTTPLRWRRHHLGDA